MLYGAGSPSGMVNLVTKKPLDAQFSNLGFTFGQKVFWTAVALIYFISPIDIIPDILFPPFGFLDDGFVFYLVYCVWKGPTLPPGSLCPTAAQNPSRTDAPHGQFAPSAHPQAISVSARRVVATQE